MPQPNEINLTPIRARIGAAIWKISERSPTYMRRFLDEYLTKATLNPSMAEAGDSALPLALRRHPKSADRTGYGTKDYVLYFHCGNAIVTFYDAVLGVDVGTALEARVKLLEAIVDRGYADFRLDGDDGKGFRLRNDAFDAALFGDTLVK
jgi:hypothetical protein